MSLSKEKQLILKIKEMLDYRRKNIETTRISPLEYLRDIQKIVDSYEDPDYITGPIVGIPYGPEDEYRESGSGTNKPETE